MQKTTRKPCILGYSCYFQGRNTKVMEKLILFDCDRLFFKDKELAKEVCTLLREWRYYLGLASFKEERYVRFFLGEIGIDDDIWFLSCRKDGVGHREHLRAFLRRSIGGVSFGPGDVLAVVDSDEACVAAAECGMAHLRIEELEKDTVDTILAKLFVKSPSSG